MEHHTLLSLTIIVDGIVGGGTVLRAVVALSKHGNDRAAVCPCRTRFLWGGGGDELRREGEGEGRGEGREREGRGGEGRGGEGEREGVGEEGRRKGRG